jgi:hypothetical protein
MSEASSELFALDQVETERSINFACGWTELCEDLQCLCPQPSNSGYLVLNEVEIHDAGLSELNVG